MFVKLLKRMPVKKLLKIRESSKIDILKSSPKKKITKDTYMDQSNVINMN